MRGMTLLKTRAKLSVAQAIHIYNAKKASPMISAAKVATLYGVGEKTIRDIWTGRTWSRETRHLHTARACLQKTGNHLKVSNSFSSKTLTHLRNLPFRDVPASLAGSAKTVDQQLYEWDQVFWIDHEGADPFHDDWFLWQSDPENRVGSAFLANNHGLLKFE